MSSRANRRATRGSAKSRRTPVRPAKSGRFRIPWVPIVVVVGVAGVVGLIAFLIIQSGRERSPNDDAAKIAEANSDPALPGEWVDLPTLYGGPYGDTAGHVSEDVDYTEQGLPPVGGPHWAGGNCGETPADSSPTCGPVLPGIYTEPWPAESLIHTMEHAGVVVWYDTDDQVVIDELRDFVDDNRDQNVVIAPFPDLEDDTVAITVWARRDVMPIAEFSRERLDTFFDTLYCKFDPEDFCKSGGFGM